MLTDFTSKRANADAEKIKMNSLTILFEAVHAKLDKVETQINDITERCSRRLDTQTYIRT